MNGLLSKQRLQKCIALFVMATVMCLCLIGFTQPARAEGSYTVTLAPGEGFVYLNEAGVALKGEYEVPGGASFAFRVAVKDGYSGEKMAVIADNIEASSNLGAVLLRANKKGLYTLENVCFNTIVAVSNIAQAKKPIETVEAEHMTPAKAITEIVEAEHLTPAKAITEIVEAEHLTPAKDICPSDFFVNFKTPKGAYVTDVVGGSFYRDDTYGVQKCGALSFRVQVKKGYGSADLVVRADGEALTAEKGIYTLCNIRRDTTVTVSFEKWYSVSFSNSKGTKLCAVTGGVQTGNNAFCVLKGDDLSFEIGLNRGCSYSALVVRANGKVLEAKKGVYTLKNVKEDVCVTIGFVTDEEYRVTLKGGKGFAFMDLCGVRRSSAQCYFVQYGDDISFRVEVDKDYKAEELVVKANGRKLNPKQGWYTVEDITEDVEITAAFDDGMKKMKLTDKETGVTVSGYTNGKVKLQAPKLSKTDEAYTALAAKAEQLDVLGAYDVKLSGAKTKGSYRVTAPVDEKYEGKYVYVLRLKKDGKTVERLTIPVKKGKVTFKSKYVSPFMVAGSLTEGIIEPPKSGDKETGMNTGILMMELAGMLFVGTLLMRGKKKVAE